MIHIDKKKLNVPFLVAAAADSAGGVAWRSLSANFCTFNVSCAARGPQASRATIDLQLLADQLGFYIFALPVSSSLHQRLVHLPLSIPTVMYSK